MKAQRGRPIADGESDRVVPTRNGILHKNYHITVAQDTKIKLLAGYWGITEAAVIRRLLDDHIQQYVDEAYKDAEEAWATGTRRDVDV